VRLPTTFAGLDIDHIVAHLTIGILSHLSRLNGALYRWTSSHHERWSVHSPRDMWMS
jgi:hypothetical protein